MERTDADVIAETREYIEEHGWIRGYMRDSSSGEVCTLGGIVYSQEWIDLYEDALTNENDIRRIVGKVLRATTITGQSMSSLTQWNDRYATGKQHVLDTLAKAEKIERCGFDPDEGIVL